MTPSADIMGVDVSPFVIDYGDLDQVESILLGDAEPITSELSIELSNPDGRFSPSGTASLFRGLDWYGRNMTIASDGVVIYQGVMKNIETDPVARTVRVRSENVLRSAAQTAIILSANGQRPGAAMLAILRQALPDDFLDVPSFLASDGPSAGAGATVNLSFASGGNSTALEAAKQIGSLSSLNLTVSASRIGCRAFRRYQGSSAGLRYPIDDTIAREWGAQRYDDTAFNNEVSVGYPVALSVVRRDDESVRVNGGVRRVEFPGTGSVVAANAASAAFYAGEYLARAAFRRALIPVVVGPESAREQVGFRYPVTQSALGYNGLPAELIELRRSLTTDDVEMTLAQLPTGA